MKIWRAEVELTYQRRLLTERKAFLIEAADVVEARSTSMKTAEDYAQFSKTLDGITVVRVISVQLPLDMGNWV